MLTFPVQCCVSPPVQAGVVARRLTAVPPLFLAIKTKETHERNEIAELHQVGAE